MEHNFPTSIFSGNYHTGHCQGIAVDKKNRVIYYSFTTQLVKTDFDGRFLGSVTGLLAHLGCISFNEEDGLVYGSLEYKNDAIGRGILKHISKEEELENAFYIAIFDGEKITRENMDAESDGIMRATFLKRVTDDYLGTAPNGQPHIHGCSGIDGTAIGPVPGEVGGKNYLFVSYGVYGDTTRQDNDYQVLLRYDIAELKKYARPLSQKNMHKSGAEMRGQAYFLYTGNTEYGVQNLEYDPFTKSYFLCVYRGKKPQFPNFPLFMLDATVPAREEELKGCNGEKGNVLTLKEGGLQSASGVSGYPYEYGSTGFAALGNGLYYVSYDGRNGNDWFTTVRLCAWDSKTPLTIVL